jgi:hypothetical protein
MWHCGFACGQKSVDDDKRGRNHGGKRWGVEEPNAHSVHPYVTVMQSARLVLSFHRSDGVPGLNLLTSSRKRGTFRSGKRRRRHAAAEVLEDDDGESQRLEKFGR